MQITVPLIRERKGKEKITVLAAYTYPIAQIIDGEVDIILVGDSLGMVVYGMESTLSVPLDIMINHGKAVTRGAKKSLVVVDMPFGSYQEGEAQAFRNAARVMAETNCHAVKLEGGKEIAPTIKFLTERGIPVMGHVGLEPQSFNVYGGFKIQGKDEASAKKILDGAKAVAEAGAFSIVVEGVKKTLADQITKAVKVPIIGIGASPKCDGQVLVLDDLLALTAAQPKFVKTYANLRGDIGKAVKKYAAEVKSGKFPSADNCY